MCLLKKCFTFDKVYSQSKQYEIIALIPVSVNDVKPYGILWSEAFRYYISNANKECDIFFYRMYDLPLRRRNYAVTNLTMDIVLDKKFTKNPGSDNCECKKENEKLSHLLGIVGPSSSTYAEFISKLIRYEEIPIVSYLATSDTLSNKVNYPNVLRTIPKDSVQVEVMYSLISLFNWTYVSLIYEESSYGNSGYQAIKNKRVCLAKEIMIATNFSNINESFHKLREDNKSKVVIIYATYSRTKAFLEKAYQERFTDRIWILSESSGKKPWFLELAKNFSACFFHIIPAPGEDKEFQEHFLNLTNPSYTKNPWLHLFFQKLGVNKNDSTTKLEAYKDSFDFSYVGFVRNSVQALIETFYNALNTSFPNCELSRSRPVSSVKNISIVKSISFKGLRGEEVQFNENGDVLNFFFDVYTIKRSNVYFNMTNNIQNITKFVKFSEWIPSTKSLEKVNTEIYESFVTVESKCSDTCHPGYTNKSYDGNKPCCWKCFVCPANQVKPAYGNVKCQQCPLNTIANKNQTYCRAKVNIRIRLTESCGFIILLLSCISISFNSLTIFMFLWKRTTPVVRSSNFYLSMGQLFCHLVVFLSPALFLGENTLTKCQLRSYGTSFFYILIIAISLTKITQMLDIFKMKLILTRWEVIQKKTTGFVIAIACVIVMVIITFILQEDTKLVIANQNSKNVEIYHKCFSHTNYMAHVVYVLFLQITCGIQSFRGRHIPSKYNEAMYLAFSMFLSTVFLLVMLILKVNIETYKGTIVIESIMITCANMTILLSLYGYKVLVLLFKPQENTVAVFTRSCIVRPLDDSTAEEPFYSELKRSITDKFLVKQTTDNKYLNIKSTHKIHSSIPLKFGQRRTKSASDAGKMSAANRFLVKQTTDNKYLGTKSTHKMRSSISLKFGQRRTKSATDADKMSAANRFLVKQTTDKKYLGTKSTHKRRSSIVLKYVQHKPKSVSNVDEVLGCINDAFENSEFIRPDEFNEKLS